MLPLLVALELVASILVDLSEQRLYAYDLHERLIYSAQVSTGNPSSPTPVGDYQIVSKYPRTHMTGSDYHIPVVENVMCLGGAGLPADSICLHPAPWQERAGLCFGVARSHGCIRTSTPTARWLFQRTPVGTPVTIRE
jgi:lipoprotein-anchoring transpeptidase ErfK/SrfK